MRYLHDLVRHLLGRPTCPGNPWGHEDWRRAKTRRCIHCGERA